MPAERVLVVEDDRFLRVVGIVLDPGTSAERQAAYADFFAHDEPDFEGYCARLRARVGSLFPSEVRLVDSPERMRAALPGSHALVVESRLHGRERLLVDIERFAVGSIADGMRVHLVPVLHRDRGGPRDIVDLLQHQAGRFGQVHVRLEEPRAVGAEGRPRMGGVARPARTHIACSGAAPGEWSGCEWVHTIMRMSPPAARQSLSRCSVSAGPGSMAM